MKNTYSNIVFVLLFLASIYGNAQTQFFTSFDGTKIAYSDEGKGKPIVLIHGFINTSKSWGRTQLKKDLLEKGCRVIALDLRGNGASDKPHDAVAYQNDAEIKDIIALANHLKLKKYKAVGYSRGSIVLAKLLTQDKRIKKAVLGGMGVDFTNPDWDRRILFAGAFAEGAPVNPETQGAVDYAKSIDADLRVLHLSQVYQPVTSKEELSRLKVKVLVIAGDEDLDNGNPEELQNAIPKSKLAIVEGDHNGTYKTAAFSNKVISFLK